MPDEPLRLSKVVAARVPCSRREAEQYIAEGWVRVDGQVVDEPQFRVAGQRVEIDPRASLQPATPATRCCGWSTTWPSTRTQPSAMYCSASRREQGTSAATTFDSRVGSSVIVFRAG